MRTCSVLFLLVLWLLAQWSPQRLGLWQVNRIWRRQASDHDHHNIDTDDMMTSSNGNIFRVTGPLCGEFTGPGEFPTQRPVTRSFDVLFDLRLNKRLSKQPWGWWFETSSWSLWRQRNEKGWNYKLWILYGNIFRFDVIRVGLKHMKQTYVLSSTVFPPLNLPNIVFSQWNIKVWQFYRTFAVSKIKLSIFRRYTLIYTLTEQIFCWIEQTAKDNDITTVYDKFSITNMTPFGIWNMYCTKLHQYTL